MNKAVCACSDWVTCAYCDSSLSSRHEHDHFPVPKRHGGAKTVPVCINCHDLKDRMFLDQSPIAFEVMRVWSQLPSSVRIFIAKTYALLLDAQKEVA